MGSHRRVDVRGGCEGPVWFCCVADVATSRESQLSVDRPATMVRLTKTLTALLGASVCIAVNGELKSPSRSLFIIWPYV